MIRKPISPTQYKYKFGTQPMHYQGSGSIYICTGSRGTFAINSSSSRCSAVLSRHAVNTVVSDPSDLVLCD